ncbi:hypothetical protein [Mucilaginibacter sp. dw_454]|uniref:hypothetical protein n=1 Tax=Mucilaginibacter sp. dw_454 TaxID=2720079 RepID=UPI001BD395EC|nr:hypothetical protein [Mucilaginibacter sp. dw_454]
MDPFYQQPYSFPHLHWNWNLLELMMTHPILGLILGVLLLRGVFRWFLGIKRLSSKQDRYMELLEEHNALLRRQNDMLSRHDSVLGKLGEKYLS